MGPFSIMIAQFGTGRTGRFSDRRLSLLFLVHQRRLHKSVEQGVCVVGTALELRVELGPAGFLTDGYLCSSWCFSAASTNPWNRGCAWSGRMGASRAISFNARGARRPRRQPPRTADGYLCSSWCFSAASTNPWNRGCAWSGRMGASRAISFNARGARRPRRQPPRTGGAVPTVISALPGASAPPPQIRGTGGVRGRDGS